MSNFATFMNLPPPLSKTGYNKINDKLNSVYKEVAEKSCQEAVKETHTVVSLEDQLMGMMWLTAKFQWMDLGKREATCHLMGL